MLREDGTGAIEYFYGKIGEVTKTRRTLIVPNQAIATYVTQWTCDSHNRLLEMIYPDEKKITYSYNLGGQLEKVHGYKSYGYDYVSKIGYDRFEQRTYIKEIGTNIVEGFMNVTVDILVDQRDMSFDDAKSVITQSIITLL